MMRWIVPSACGSGIAGESRRGVMLIFGGLQLSDDAGGRVPGVRAAEGGGPDGLRRPVGCGGRGAHHRAPRAGAQRGVRPGGDALEVGRASSPRSMLIFEPGTDISRPGSSCQERVATVTPTLPSWATPPVHDPAAVVHQPGDEDRRLLGHLVAIEMSHGRRSGRSEHSLLRVPGVANVAIWGNGASSSSRSRSTLGGCVPRGVAEPGDERSQRRARRRPPPVRRRRGLGTGGTSTRRTSAWASRMSCRSGRRRGAGRRSPSEPTTAVPYASATSHSVVNGHQPLIGDAVDQRRARAAC